MAAAAGAAAGSMLALCQGQYVRTLHDLPSGVAPSLLAGTCCILTADASMQYNGFCMQLCSAVAKGQPAKIQHSKHTSMESRFTWLALLASLCLAGNTGAFLFAQL